MNIVELQHDINAVFAKHIGTDYSGGQIEVLISNTEFGKIGFHNDTDTCVTMIIRMNDVVIEAWESEEEPETEDNNK